MSKQSIVLTVSAYGAMSDSSSRCRAVIVAGTPEEFMGKLREFFANEVNRAKNIEELSDSQITEIAIPDEFVIPQPGNREVVPVPELATDYHIESPQTEIVNDRVDEIRACHDAYVFTAYKRGFCCEESEFPDTMAVCFIDDTPDANAKRLCEETVHYMAWDCQMVPVL